MPTKIGHFEILSELAKSATGAVYKASDPQSGQTIALKAIQLSAFGESAPQLQSALLAEAESTKVLNSQNIVLVYGAGEIEGQFCAAMEYVQGNSIATMVAHKEGFSIWDLLDICRQTCSGLDHAHGKNVYHSSLEPAKVMCGWDGMTKILGFGVSCAANFTAQSTELPSFLYYLSPEQVRGEAIDGRSNLFSLGAMLYEMVTDRRAFDGESREALAESILQTTPPPPAQLNPKLHPVLSGLILKALEKDPSQRFQTGRQLLDELEKCKESKSQAAKPAATSAKPNVQPAPGGPAVKKAAPSPAGVVPAAAKAAAQSKFVGGSAPTVASKPPVLPKPVAPTVTPAPRTMPRPTMPAAVPATVASASGAGAKMAPASPKAAPILPEAEIGIKDGAVQASALAPAVTDAAKRSASRGLPELDSSNQFITSCVKATIESAGASEAFASSVSAVAGPAVVEEEPIEEAASAPRIAVDPMMAGGGSRGASVSFSEISELPPLKEVYVEPPPPPPIFEAAPAAPTTSTMFDETAFNQQQEEKPKVQPREVAEKAIKEIKNVPPKLLLYSLGTAAAVIVVIVAGLLWHIHNLNSEVDSGSAPAAAVTESAPAAQPPNTPQQAANTPAQRLAIEPAPEPAEPEHGVIPSAKHAAKSKKKTAPAPAAPVVLTGEMVLDSTPQGAQVQIDGTSNPSWVTPLAMSGLAAGSHTVTVSKAGFSTDTRAIAITSGNRTSMSVRLAQLMATLSVSSDPAGANIFIDGHDTGKVTPAQLTMDKGQHVVLIRKMGYLDETAALQFVLGQTISLSPALRSLGNAESIRTVGKMKKLFGGAGTPAGEVSISIRTQPKGAQVAINQHMIEKGTPVDVTLDPGNYVIDLTLTGYAPIHKVVTADKGSKLVVDEVMQRQ